MTRQAGTQGHDGAADLEAPPSRPLAPKRPIEDWVLLRGLSREQRQWGRFPEALAELTGARVHTLDLPGIGDAQHRAAPLSVKVMADDLDGRMAGLEGVHGGPFGLLGVSLGGMTTLAWAASRPGRFAATVVVNASAAGLSGPLRRLRPGVLPVVARAVRAGPGVEQELITLSLTTTHRHGDRALAEAWAAYRAERPVKKGAIARQLVAGLGFRAPRRLGAPTLFVSGAQDRFVHPHCTRRLARRYGAPHVEHPTAGHDLALDAPDWLAEQVRTFVSTS